MGVRIEVEGQNLGDVQAQLRIRSTERPALALTAEQIRKVRVARMYHAKEPSDYDPPLEVIQQLLECRAWEAEELLEQLTRWEGLR